VHLYESSQVPKEVHPSSVCQAVNHLAEYLSEEAAWEQSADQEVMILAQMAACHRRLVKWQRRVDRKSRMIIKVAVLIVQRSL